MKRPKKMKHLIEVVRDCLDSGRFRDTYHSSHRQSERQITRSEMVYALKNGWHEREKDKFSELYLEWNYSIRGRTIDDKILRIIVSFDDEGMLIITGMVLKS